MKKTQKNKSKKDKIFIYSCACHRRDLDAKKVSKYFLRNEYKLVNDPKNADYIVFFACGFVNEIADECIKTVKRLKKYDAELIVAGCLPEMEKEKLNEFFDGKTIPAKNMEKIDDIFKNNKIKYEEIDDENIIWRNFNPIGISKASIELYKAVFRKSNVAKKIILFIKNHLLKNVTKTNPLIYEVLFPEFLNYYVIMTSRGCTKNCYYCAIKKAIGTLKSKPLNQCIKEFEKGLAVGHKNFVITADDVGTYGTDIGSNFPELLDNITRIEGDHEIEIQGLNPVWVMKYIDELEEILKRGKIKTIISPIQSGSSRILKLMNRYHDTEKMRNAFIRLKKFYTDLSLETNYLVGFPTENDEDIHQTLNFIKMVHFNVCYIFPFSLKTDTEAEKLEPKISRRIISRRLKYAKNT